jgi:hypothetical protein
LLIVGETARRDVVAVARKEKQVALPTSAEWTALIHRGRFLISCCKTKASLWRDHGLWRFVLAEIQPTKRMSAYCICRVFMAVAWDKLRPNYSACCCSGAFILFGTLLFGFSACLVTAFGLMLNEDVIPVTLGRFGGCLGGSDAFVLYRWGIGR